MKTERRHDLETNTLAKFLTTWSDRLRPHGNAVAIGAVSIVALFFIISWVAGGSSTRDAAAWDEYNAAVEGYSPKMQELKQSAELHVGTPMQQWADITWADGQLLSASRGYLVNREAADKSLELAASAYQTLLRTATDNPRVIDRANFGLARVYELRQELDKAREHYLAVKGSFSELAERRAEELESARTKDAVAWLASAEVPRRPAPTGPGTPGQRPEFSADPVDMPAEQQPGDVDAALKDIFDRFNKSTDALEGEGAGDRYQVPEGESEQQPEGAATEGEQVEEDEVSLELDVNRTPSEDSAFQE